MYEPFVSSFFRVGKKYLTFTMLSRVVQGEFPCKRNVGFWFIFVELVSKSVLGTRWGGRKKGLCIHLKGVVLSLVLTRLLRLRQFKIKLLSLFFVSAWCSGGVFFVLWWYPTLNGGSKGSCDCSRYNSYPPYVCAAALCRQMMSTDLSLWFHVLVVVFEFRLVRSR